MRTPRRITLVFSLMLQAALVWAASAVDAPRRLLPPREGPALGAARTWGYQLRNVEAGQLSPDLDVIVVDYSRDGSDFRAWTPQEVEGLRQRPDGRRRIVLAYLSVGRAESRRFYWWRYWWLLPPSWLGEEDGQGSGRYRVRHGDPGWQRIFMSANPSVMSRIAELQLGWRKPYLDRILEAGFDGVYLAGLEGLDEPQAAQDMARLVTGLTGYARARKPGFLIVPQNGEVLLKDPAYRASIDGIAREGLVFRANGEDDAKADTTVLALLSEAKAEGRPVFIVQYGDDPEQQALVRQIAADRGFVLLFATRGLDRPPVIPAPEPAPGLPAP